MKPVVEVDALTIQYGQNRALANVSLSARPGAVLAVTGASGAGKTSLLWAIAGLLVPDEGRVVVSGQPVTTREDAVAAEAHLIPQGNGLASVLTARENVAVAPLAAGVDPAEAARRADSSLERLGVGKQADQLAEELSGGQRQRVAFARGLAMRAPILLADEVTSDLDAENRDLVLDLLQHEAKRGAAVVFATNDIKAATGCEERIHLVDGHVDAAPGPQ